MCACVHTVQTQAHMSVKIRRLGSGGIALLGLSEHENPEVFCEDRNSRQVEIKRKYVRIIKRVLAGIYPSL